MNVSASEFNCSIELHNNQKDCKCHTKWHEKKKNRKTIEKKAAGKSR